MVNRFLSILFSPRGRINRLEFFLAQVFLVSFMGLSILILWGEIFPEVIGMLILTIAILIFILSSIFTQLKRLRDIGWSPLWMILTFIFSLYIGWILLSLVKGKKESNVPVQSEKQEL